MATEKPKQPQPIPKQPGPKHDISKEGWQPASPGRRPSGPPPPPPPVPKEN